MKNLDLLQKKLSRCIAQAQQLTHLNVEKIE